MNSTAIAARIKPMIRMDLLMPFAVMRRAISSDKRKATHKIELKSPISTARMP